MPDTIEFNDDELQQIRTALHQSYQKDIEIELSYREDSRDKNSPKSTRKAAVHWYDNHTHFLIVKTGEQTYRPQFFHTPHDRVTLESDADQDLKVCVSQLLKAQREQNQTISH